MNLAILQGNLGADPEVRTTQGGESVCTLSVATNEKWTDKDGKTQERVEWHRVVVWGRSADACGQYLRKGAAVLVRGQIQTRKWVDDKGVERYSTEIRADRVDFLSRAEGGGRGGPPPGDDDRRGGGRYGPRDDRGGGTGGSSQSGPSPAGGGPSGYDDDIPF